MGAGQDLFVEHLSLSILALFQVTGSLGADGTARQGAGDEDKVLANLQDFYFLSFFYLCVGRLTLGSAHSLQLYIQRSEDHILPRPNWGQPHTRQES